MRKYTPVKADNYCCIGAVLETILLKYGYNQFSQYDIINEFGLIIPRNTVISERIKNVTYSENPNDWGVKLKLESLNDFFNNNSILLTEEYISIRMIADYNFENVLTNISDMFDLIFGFDYGVLYNIPESRNIGHVGIFTQLNDNTISYLDPGPKNFGIRKVNIDDLYSSIKSKSDGLWIIKQQGTTRAHK